MDCANRLQQRRYNNHGVSSYSGISVLEIALLTATLFLLTTSGVYGSYSSLRIPRLELKKNNENGRVVLYFYNADTLNIEGKMEDAVECTVTGGHFEKGIDGWEQVTTVDLKCSPTMEVWEKKKLFAVAQSSDKLRTRRSYDVKYNVEGNLTCTDTLGKGLVSNTMLIQFQNYESVIVRIKNKLSMEQLRGFTERFVGVAQFNFIGRLLSIEDKQNERVATFRVSSKIEKGENDLDKLINNVKEYTEWLFKYQNTTIEYVRSTRSCLSVEEGNFSWPLTSSGQIAIPNNPCIDVNDDPMPRRMCMGNFFEGVYWDAVPERPLVCHDPNDRSTKLQGITKRLNRHISLDDLLEVISKGSKLSPVEIYFVSEVLKKASQEPDNKVATIAKVMNLVLDAGTEIIKEADESYGSSGSILESVDDLLQAAASPFPTPVSMEHFSAFSSFSGTGIQGFAFIPSKHQNGTGRMVVFDRNNTVTEVLRLGPNVVAFLDTKEEYGITVTLYEEGSLFSSPSTSMTMLEEPVFGMKLLHKEDTQKPVSLIIRFLHDQKKPKGRYCASWEPTREGGWSTAGCKRLSSDPSKTICSCTILTSLAMYYTLIVDDKTASISVSQSRLDLLPLKNNVGALLHVYTSAKLKASTDFLCLVSWGDYNNGSSNLAALEKIEEKGKGFRQWLAIYKVSSNSEGNVQCSYNSSLMSNKNLMLFENTAILYLDVFQPTNAEKVIHNYVMNHSLTLNFTKVTSQKDTGQEEFRVSTFSDIDHEEFIKRLSNMFYDIQTTHNMSLIQIKSNRLCLKHDEGGFKWPNTKLGRLATPINPCIDSHGTPIPVRRCIGDHANGMFWEPVPPRPDPCIQPENRVEELQDITAKINNNDVFQEILDTIGEQPVLSFVEVKALTDALRNIVKETADPVKNAPKRNISTFAQVVNTVLEFEQETYGKSNSTLPKDEILDSIDKFLEISSTGKPEPVTTKHFTAVSVAPGSKYLGFIQVADENLDNQTKVEAIKQGDNWQERVTNVQSKPVQVGAILLEAPEDVGVSYTTFQNDSLFVGSGTEDARVDTPVVGLKMFGKDGIDLSDAENLQVLILFTRNNSNTRHRRCFFWDTKMGKWSDEGCTRVPSCNLPNEIPADLDACMCTHLTHFAMLVSTAEYQEEDILHMLTLVGCSISLISLILIFLISIFSPQWRRGASKKVQLNLSASLALLMASYLAVASLGECPSSLFSCIALGTVVHYSVLAAFSWMLVAAVLQVLRLTPSMAVDSRRRAGTHLVLKASVFGWGLPAIPVAITLGIDSKLYVRRENTALCYPTGRPFYLAVLFPVTVAITMNIIAFIWLMRMLFCNKLEEVRVHSRGKRNQALRRYFSALFLFCLLGITWVSGIAVEVTITSKAISNYISYVFCATATLQGASLFVFFVACERRVGSKLSDALSFIRRSNKVGNSRKGYTNKFDSSISDSKSTKNTELRDSDSHRKADLDLVSL